MIIVKNRGEMDVRGALTFGVSVKKSDNPFGMFGTGLKYAIAILLRTGHEVEILTGGETYLFGLKKTSFRGESIRVVTMNGERLGFTSHLGEHWELWQAYRELICNAMDEREFEVIQRSVSPPINNAYTYIIIKGPQIEQIYTERRKYFLFEQTPIYRMATVDVYNLPEQAIFYKGVYVGRIRNQRHSYNILTDVDLTEDRTLKSEYNVMWEIGEAVCKCDDLETIMAILSKGTSEKVCMEGGLNYQEDIASDRFKEIVSELVRTGASIHANARYQFSGWKCCPTTFELYEPSSLEQKMILKAMEFCQSLGYPVTYPIKWVERLPSHMIGYADTAHGEIIIARIVFNSGTRYLASTLLEEVIHLQTGYDDCTRDMQTHLFDLILKLGEELRGDPL